MNNNNSSNSNLTTRYKYGNDDHEYILSCKGRPFAVLVSPHLQKPTYTLLDYDLVRSLGMKLTDLQCRKYTLAGHKFRILGRVSTAVQCVQHGKVSSTFQMKAMVVSDLYATLDTHCVASVKLEQHLASQETIVIVDDEEEDRAPSPETSPRPPAQSAASPGPPATDAVTPGPPRPPAPSAAPPEPPATDAVTPGPPTPAQVSPAPAAASVTPLAPTTPPRGSSPPAASAARSPRSPPGFPTTPQHQASLPSAGTEARTETTIPVRRVVDGLELSPFSANIRALGDTFQDADLQRGDNEQIWTLEEVDEDGYLDTNGHGGECTYTFTNGLRYSVNHGRHGCSRVKCPQSNLSQKPMFHNCGYHPQWHLPRGFTPCGDRCRAAFCFCLRQYHRQVCPDTASYQAHLRKVRLEEEEEKKRRGRK